MRETESIPPPSFPSSLPSSYIGGLVSPFFYLLLLVSTDFHALALPILVRHLFAGSPTLNPNRREAEAYYKGMVALLIKYELDASVRSLVLPPTLTDAEQGEHGGACSALETLHFHPSSAASSLISFPISTTHLFLNGEDCTLAYTDLGSSFKGARLS